MWKMYTLRKKLHVLVCYRFMLNDVCWREKFCSLFLVSSCLITILFWGFHSSNTVITSHGQSCINKIVIAWYKFKWKIKKKMALRCLRGVPVWVLGPQVRGKVLTHINLIKPVDVGITVSYVKQFVDPSPLL